MMTPLPLCVVWLRRSFRLADNLMLLAAVETGMPILVVTIQPDEDATQHSEWGQPGSASRWWLHHTLSKLEQRLAEHSPGQRLHVLTGTPLDALEVLRQQLQGAFHTLITDELVEPHARQTTEQVAAWAQSHGIVLQRFYTNLLAPPTLVKNKEGEPFKVFSAFWRAMFRGFTSGELKRRSAIPLPPPLPRPPQAVVDAVPAVPIERLAFLPNIPRERPWDTGFYEVWSPGEVEAHATLATFLGERVHGYPTDRDFPFKAGTSTLSPALHFGEVSPIQVWETVEKHAGVLTEAHALKSGSGAGGFIRELAWREFAHYLLYHFPQTTNSPLNPTFEAFPWVDNPEWLHAWQRGQTGYPIVDAGMRQLWTTGWMHNRVRMIVASFLVKHLRIHWLEGSRWFWDTLVDADLASNTLGWQWSAGCGADAAPYFRIFNPMLQGKKFDPDGEYVRRWVPELRRLPSQWVHEPWNAPSLMLHNVGIRLGHTYPLPLVDHDKARDAALEAFSQLKQGRREGYSLAGR
jgi:deoxyribodipyrimidine photo-lyase